MGLPIVFTRTLAASNNTAVAASQSPGAGVIALNTTTVILDTQRRIILTSGGNDTGINFTVFGTNQAGFPIQDTFAGTNGTATPAQSNLDFLTVTNITHSGSVASTLLAGTNGVGSSLWNIVNWHADPQSLGFVVELRSGSANFTMQYTFDDPNILPMTGGLNAAGLAFPLALNLATVTNATATIDSVFSSPVVAFRLLTNSGTGTLVFRGLQAGLGSP
jgi:hypothetical protein